MPAEKGHSMPTFPRFALLPIGCAVLMTAAAPFAVPGASAQRSAASKASLSLRITTTGSTVWGTVTATYASSNKTTHRSCSAAVCSWRVPQGVTLHLTQTAADSATWPFHGWKVRTGGTTRTMMAGSIRLKVKGTTNVTAVYVLAQSQSSSSGSSGGYGYGSDGYTP